MNGIRDRIGAVLLVALLVFSCFATLTIGNASAAFENKNIKVTVDDNFFNGISGATVTLTEVHTGAVLHPTASGSIGDYIVSEAPSGYYRISVSAVGFVSSLGVFGISHDALKNTSITIALNALAFLQHTLTVTVVDGLGNPIQGASVSFYDPANKQYVNGVQTSGVTNITGVAIVKIYNGVPVDLVVTQNSYEMSVTQYAAGVLASANVPITLTHSVVVHGDFKNSQGNDASNVIGYLYNTNPAVPKEKRILRSASGSNTARFDAFAGNWVLVIDAKDGDPYVNTSVTVVATPIDVSKTLSAQSQSTERVWVNMTTWNALSIHVNGVWKADMPYYGIDYSDIGCIRAQVDLAMGDGDGLVDGTEWTDFTNNVVAVQGPNYVSTSDLLVVNDNGVTANDTAYKSSIVNPISLSAVAGSVALTANIAYSSDVTYNSNTALPASSETYAAVSKIPYDSLSINRSFLFDLPAGYELEFNQTLTTKIVVSGYLIISIDPQVSATPGIEPVSMTIGKSEVPIAKGQIIVADNAFARRNATQVLLGYTVRNGTNVTFSALGSADPNGNPVTFTWNFGDGSPLKVTKNLQAWHNYTAPHNWSAVLTVTDVVGMSNTSTMNVSVDGKLPRPTIVVQNGTGSTLSGAITINQRESLKFLPTGSVDDLITTGDHLGQIQFYDWKIGTSATVRRLPTDTDINITYTFVDAGSIKVVLNITDIVGNYKNTTKIITVKDKQAPTIEISKILNATWGTSLLERQATHFNASGTTDNIDALSSLTFKWNFGDNSANKTGVGLWNVTHNYSSYGQYKVTLNVSDLSGNNASLTQTVFIGAGHRPDVSAVKVTYDPATFEEGVSGKITVNITNSGSASASSITIELWYYSGSVAQKQIGNISTIYSPNGTLITSLGVGESGYGVYYWTPDAQGNYTIRAIVNCTDQKQSNTLPSSINVNEAGWKKTALYVGIIVVVIVVPLLLLARRRIGSTGAMLRRPKKEKEKKEDKEK